MVHQRTQFLISTAVLFAVLAGGCGGIGDPRKPTHSDAATSPETPVAQADTIIPPPDTGPPLHDSGAPIDMSARDGQPLEAGGEASAPVDGPSAPEIASIDSGIVADAAGPESPARPPTTLVVLPDTQYYASTYPEVFSQQTDWILEQRIPRNISAVLHVGDIVDGDTTEQWTVAKTAMRVLDGVVPYVLAVGNHDTDGNRLTKIDDYFAPNTMPWINGTMVPGKIENNYTILNIGGRPWLVVSIEFGPRNTVVGWADTILKAYPNTPAMLLTHAYLYRDGTRYDIAKGGTDSGKPSFQHFNPVLYGFTASEGINDGEMLWQKLVLTNPNVRLIFCGHDTGWSRLSSTRPDGSVVHQMLSDYQWLDGPNFGYGYLRILQFDYAQKTLSVQTYSPYLQAYKTDDDNQFTLDLHY